MGCASSKHRNRCRNCRGVQSRVIVPRSYSMHVHHPAQHTGDSYHTVALTSSTIGSLNICDSSSSFRNIHKHLEDSNQKKHISDEMGVLRIDLKMEKSISSELIILLWSKISLKKVMRMKLVSKTWALLIDDFTKHMAPTLPRAVFSYLASRLQERVRKFSSVSLHNSTSQEDVWMCTKGFAAGKEICSGPVDGLICVGLDDKTTYKLDICNFITGKSVSLPDIQKVSGEQTSSFLGKELLKDQFKMLCLCVKDMHDKVPVLTTQLFSLKGIDASPDQSWREIESPFPHSPVNKSGMSKDGFIYYGAWDINGNLFLMSFNLTTEAFSPFYLDLEIKKHPDPWLMSIQVMEYCGEVALVVFQRLDFNRFGYAIWVMKTVGWERLSSELVAVDNSPLKLLFLEGAIESGTQVFAGINLLYVGELCPLTGDYIPLSPLYLLFNKVNDGLVKVRYDNFKEEQYVSGTLDTFVGTLSLINPEELLEY